MSQLGFFDLSDRYEAITKFGDPLEKLEEVVNFELLRKELKKALKFSRRLKGGRPPHDCVLMLKILILQTLYNLSDDQTEFQIKDRLSFMRFLGLGLSDRVPDAKTIWLYRERFSRKGIIDKVFAHFDESLREQGYLAMSGQIVDASIISVPRQRHTKEEKQSLANGETPDHWQENPAQLAQKDQDARWIVKYRKAKEKEGKKMLDIAIPLYGYKNHISTDKRYGFIRKYHVTDASVYDGKVLPRIINKDNTGSGVWGDTAYRSAANEQYLNDHGLKSNLHRKKPRGKPMPEKTRLANTRKSSIRTKVEHVFAVQKHHMSLFIRTIGIKRAEAKIALANLVYNMKRLIFFETRCALAG